MTPKGDIFRQLNNDDSSAECSWRGDTEEMKRSNSNSSTTAATATTKSNRAAVKTLRELGLLRWPPTATRMLCETSTSSSWYCTSSEEDDEDDTAYGDDDSSWDEFEEAEKVQEQHQLGLFEIEYRCAAATTTTTTTRTVTSSSTVTTFYGIGGGPLTGMGVNVLTPKKKREQARQQVKMELDEKLVQENIKRRSIKFDEDSPQVLVFEPAPLELYGDLYYSCHQLQKMVEEANSEKEEAAAATLPLQPQGNNDDIDDDDDYNNQMHHDFNAEEECIVAAATTTTAAAMGVVAAAEKP